jgi:uncharacterized protein (DUF1697 family)
MANSQRYVAFLRAINVGGHVVKMDRLRELFESMSLRRVETFIASGNVLFDASVKDTVALEQQIEARLAKALGYEVVTYLRSSSELIALSRYVPSFTESLEDTHSMFVGFLKSTPSSDACRMLDDQCSTDVDDFHVYGRELFWRCRVRFNESKVSQPRLAKALGSPVTFRNVTTVRRLALKC